MRTFLKILLLVFVIVIVAGALLGNMAWSRLHEPYKGYEAAEQFVDIPARAGTADIRKRLLDARVIRDEHVFRAALLWTGQSRSLKAGEYRFDRPMSAIEVVEKLAKGDVYSQRITFREGLMIGEMARIFEERGFGPASAFVEAAGDESLITDLDPGAADLEGYLFPETYVLPRKTAAARLVAMMVGRFRASYDASLQAAAREQSMTTREVVTLASLVEKETGAAPERPLVAAVYRNRLRIGMPMQADPTVVYALIKAGRYDGNIRRDDLQIDSPYNTYRYPGLPPGPIAAPGRASLEAAVKPAAVKHLYFVSRNDGTHVFADTLEEHNRNVHEYQVVYFRRLRQEQQKGAGERGQGAGLSQSGAARD